VSCDLSRRPQVKRLEGSVEFAEAIDGVVSMTPLRERLGELLCVVFGESSSG